MGGGAKPRRLHQYFVLFTCVLSLEIHARFGVIFTPKFDFANCILGLRVPFHFSNQPTESNNSK
jgi:hypothetical protein